MSYGILKFFKIMSSGGRGRHGLKQNLDTHPIRFCSVILCVKITCSWAGHFIGAHRCRFRRNTLLTYENLRIVVSTVGLIEHWENEDEFQKIGVDRYYETMVFHAKYDGSIGTVMLPKK